MFKMRQVYFSLLISFLIISACQSRPDVSLTPQSIISTVSVVQQSAVASTSFGYPPPNSYPVPITPPAPYGYPVSGAYPAPIIYPEPQAEVVSNSSVQPAAISPTLKPYTLETAKPGTAILHGLLLVMDPMISRPDSEDAIFLVPLTGEGVISIPAFVVGEVPRAEVDETTGEFIFRNVKPGNYAIVILTVGGSQVPARFYKDNGFAIIRVEESDLGRTIELDYLVI